MSQSGNAIGEEGWAFGKPLSISSWHQNTPDRKAMKGTAKTRLEIGDVYPHESKQDEDNMGSDKVRRGFVTGPITYEHQSLNGEIDRDDTNKKAAQMYMQVNQKKNEVNLISSKKNKDSVSQLPVASPLRGKDRVQWYVDLSKGKSEKTLLQNAPCFKNKEQMFDCLYAYRINPERAIWAMKVAANIAGNSNSRKAKPFTGEKAAVEFAHALSRPIRQVIKELGDPGKETLEECDELNEKWHYFSRLARAAFDEGVLDRQEFLNELCNIFTEIFLQRSSKNPDNDKEDTEEQMLLWMQYFNQFVPAATQNLVLARRVATMVCQKLQLMKEEFEEDEEELLLAIREDRYDYSFRPPPDEEYESGRETPPYGIIPRDAASTSKEVKDEPTTEGKVAEIEDAGTPVTGRIVEKKIKEEPIEAEPEKKEVKEEDSVKKEEKEEEEDKKEEKPKKKIPYDEDHPDKFVLDVMFHTPDRRETINCLVSLLFTCIGQQPAAMVYNKFHVGLNRAPYMLTQLGGSPLDHLPCPLLDLPFDLGSEDARDNIKEMMEMHLHDITVRSELVQNNWVATNKTQRMQAKLIDSCLDVLGHLDAVNVLAKGGLEKAFNRIFIRVKGPRYHHEVVTRIRLCLTWAITVQREGLWRGWMVAKILKLLLDARPNDEPHGYFGGNHINLIISDFINHDLPKSGEENYYKEFSNFCSLFFELIRFGVITQANFYAMWSEFHKTYCEREDVDPALPVMLAFPPVGEGDEVGKKDDATPRAEVAQDGQRMDVDGDGNIIAKPEEADQKEVVKEMEFDPNVKSFITLPEEPNDGYRLLDEDIPPMTQLVIQLPPIPGDDKQLMDLRTQILYGDDATKKVYIAAARKVAQDIRKMMTEKMFYRWKRGDVGYTRRVTAQELNGLLDRMRKHTLFDRQQIVGWVADGFKLSIQSFNQRESTKLPTHEALDLLCSLYEQTNNMHGMFELARLLLQKHFPLINRTIDSYDSIIIPGLVTAQYTYVISSYLVKHLKYFVHYEKAKMVVNLLYRRVEQLLLAEGYPRTGFGRATAVAVYHLGEQLLNSGLAESEQIQGTEDDFEQVMFQGEGASSGLKDYNRFFMVDTLGLTSLNIFEYRDFQKRLPSFKNPLNRYSFVVNAFVAASKMERDFDRLSDLASFCSHWTAHHPEMASDWSGAIRALCNGRSPQWGFKHLLDQVDVSDLSLHYALSTFALLLASKYCFSLPMMVSELIHSTFNNVQKRETGKSSSRGSSSRNDADSEPGVCLALLFLAQMCCASDDPFILSEHYRGRATVKKLLEGGCADLGILNMLHWAEMGRSLLTVVVNLGSMNDMMQSRVRDHNLKLPLLEDDQPRKREYKREYLPVILRQALISITEQDWVKDGMWDLVGQDDMAAFRDPRVKNNCLGQHLLRLSTRRRCERETLAQLAVCNGNSKRALIDKLFSTLNMWNYRATYLDLKLMIKEMSPDGSSKHAQQGAIAADALMCEIGKCARELYVQAARERRIIMQKDERFSFSSLSNFLLLPSLINDCPTPANMPSSFSASFKTKFLTEVGFLLDVGAEPNMPKLRTSNWLIHDRSFINVIMECMKGSDHDDQAAQNSFMNGLLKQIQELAKIKESDKTPTAEERQAIFLRIYLVAFVFDNILTKDTAEPWAFVLFQLMLKGVVTPMRNIQMYHTVFDMLSSIVIWSLTDEGTVQLVDNGEKNERKEERKDEKAGGKKERQKENKEEAKYRFPYYMQIVKKLKKELLDSKTSMDMSHLHSFLPIPKAFSETITFEPFGTQPGNNHRRKQVTLGQRRGRPCLQIADRTKLSAFENLQGYSPDHTNRKFASLNSYYATRLDTSITHPYQVVSRLIEHTHPLRGFVNNPLQLDAADINDTFLDPLPMEEVGVPPWIERRRKEKRRQRAARSGSDAESDEYDSDSESDDEDDTKKEEEDETSDEKKDEEPKSVATPAAVATPDTMKPPSTPLNKQIKQEIIVLDSPEKSQSTTPAQSTTPLQQAMAPPMQIPPQQPGPSGVLPAPAPVKASRQRKSTTPKDPAEKKERKRPTKRNASGLTLQTTANPLQMTTPPHGSTGVPLTHASQLQLQQQGMSQPSGAPSQLQQLMSQPQPSTSYAGGAQGAPGLPQSLQQGMQQPTSSYQGILGGAQGSTHPSQLQQQGMLQQQPQPSTSSYPGAGAGDWKPNPAAIKQEQFTTPQKAQIADAASSKMLGRLGKPLKQELQPAQQLQQDPMQQQQRMQQMQQGHGSSQQIFMAHVKQEQQPQQHGDGGDASARSKLHDMLSKRQDEKAARHDVKAELVTPEKSQAGGQRRYSPDPANLGQLLQQPAQQPQQGMIQPTASQMGQPGMMQRQPDHRQTNELLASNIKHRQELAAAQAARAAQSQQPAVSTQQGMQQMQRTPQYPQQGQMMQPQQADLLGDQGQQRAPPQRQLTLDERRKLERMQQLQQHQQQLQQQQQQQQQQYDPAAATAKLPAMGGGADPYPNRPGAPAHNQSTNPPPQQQPGQYPMHPQQRPTPDQMARLQAHRQQQLQLQQMQQQQQAQGSSQLSSAEAQQRQLQMQQMQLQRGMQQPPQGAVAQPPQYSAAQMQQHRQQQLQHLQQQRMQQAQQQQGSQHPYNPGQQPPQ